MFDLEWSEEAFSQMQDVIDRHVIAKEWVAAVLRLCTQLLRRTPNELGESRDRGDRFWCIRPLAFSFNVDRANRRVKIHSVIEL
jgi:hypothetical protein